MKKRIAPYADMVKHLPVNVLLCDPKSFTITYANPRSVETLVNIRHLLPEGFEPEQVVGSSIDIFHTHPGHQRAILSDPSRLPHKSVIRMGDEFLSLEIMPLTHRGHTHSLMLTWSVVTLAERLKRMVDTMPINVMLCDPKRFTITYINRTSIETLRRIEHLLPVKADALLGASIDIFHKHPEHQRRLIADPANLPWRTKIRLGEEWLDLNVAAILDDKGHYIGAMLSWSIATDRVRVADQVQKIAANVASASSQLHANASTMAQVVNTANVQSTQVAVTASQTSGSVQAVAAAVEEMSISIQDISANMERSRLAVGEVLQQASSALRSAALLSQTATSMSGIVQVIDAIAGQINMLALNATIESARAGEAGKGFAVVAQEVKALALETGKATESIGKEITSLQSVASIVADTLTHICRAMEDATGYVTGVASAVEEQTAATKEISHSMQHASTGVSGMHQSVGEIAGSTAQADEATRQISETAGLLALQADHLNSEMRHLIA